MSGVMFVFVFIVGGESSCEYFGLIFWCVNLSCLGFFFFACCGCCFFFFIVVFCRGFFEVLCFLFFVCILSFFVWVFFVCVL